MCKKDWFNQPIPVLTNQPTSTNIPIIESNERLVVVPITHPRIFPQPTYYLQNIQDSLSRIYIREGAYKKLLVALEFLPKQYSFVVYDGYRPYRVQQQLFQMFYESIKLANSDFTEKEILTETRKYVSFPSAKKEKPSPHITGGAIDLTIGSIEGIPIEMGTPFDCMDKQSATCYFEQDTYEKSEVQYHRRLLYHVMRQAGFTNYEEEWWHYDYGNQFWAARKNKKFAIYGAITQ